MSTRRNLIVTAALTLALGACATPDSHEGDLPGSGCPITIPTGDFVPPEGYPAEPSTAADGDAWHGTDALFTVLPLDGDHVRRKNVWWSTGFPGGSVEERPPLTVTYTSLDTGVVHAFDDATNAYTVADGWFMIAAVDPDEPGCWKVSASYKGATTTYVYFSES